MRLSSVNSDTIEINSKFIRIYILITSILFSFLYYIIKFIYIYNISKSFLSVRLSNINSGTTEINSKVIHIYILIISILFSILYYIIKYIYIYSRILFFQLAIFRTVRLSSVNSRTIEINSKFIHIYIFITSILFSILYYIIKYIYILEFFSSS